MLHIAYSHHLRRQERDPERWNAAADYVINALLINAGEELPDTGLFDLKYADYSTEHAYNVLPEPPEGQRFEVSFGEVVDHPDLAGASAEDIETLESDLKVDVLQAANAAKLMGKEPAGLERLIDSIRESKLPWRRILQRFFKRVQPDDESWRVPNRRWLANNLFLPSRRSEAMGPVVIGVDTSGSIQQPELAEYFACINSILKHARPESIHVVYCDCVVGSSQVLTSRDLPLNPQKLKPSGGGGTRFEPVFDYVREHNLKPDVLLYLTDMYGSFDFKKPAYPVIWCATSNIKAPWGKTLEVTL